MTTTTFHASTGLSAHLTDLPDLAKRIYDASHLTGEFVLRSGVTSNEYFDKYRFEADPGLLSAITEAMVPLLPEGDFLAGLEMGGIPIATLLSHMTGVPTLFVRKEAKAYGTLKLAEGNDFAGKKLTIIEDVVTSGGQINTSTNELRELGALVDTAVCVIDRESGGVENLAENGIKLVSLFRMSDLLS